MISETELCERVVDDQRRAGCTSRGTGRVEGRASATRCNPGAYVGGRLWQPAKGDFRVAKEGMSLVCIMKVKFRHGIKLLRLWCFVVSRVGYV